MKQVIILEILDLLENDLPENKLLSWKYHIYLEIPDLQGNTRFNYKQNYMSYLQENKLLSWKYRIYLEISDLLRNIGFNYKQNYMSYLQELLGNTGFTRKYQI